MKKQRTSSLFAVTAVTIFVAALAAVMFLSSPAAKAEGEADSTVYLPMIVGWPPPAEFYETNFTDGIGSWAARRWSANANYEVKHNSGCDGGACGFLDLKVNNPAAYVIVSPMEPVKAPFTYSIKTRAKLVDRKDGDAYGIIFGGNGIEAGCPAADFSTCFTLYYEFRVRYRDQNGVQYLEWKLKRVEGHDENNQNYGPDIIDWKRLEGVAADSWVKWEIEVHNNGQMYIFANNEKQAGSAKDATYIHNLHYGLLGRTESSGGAHVLFDTYKIGNNE